MKLTKLVPAIAGCSPCAIAIAATCGAIAAGADHGPADVEALMHFVPDSIDFLSQFPHDHRIIP
jgi:hypothetical protein